MSGLTTPRYDSTYLAWNTVASFDDQDDARRTVEGMAEAGFPVEHLDIVGSDVRLVDRVTGRITRGRAALAGAAQGVWTGLFIGLLVGIFSGGAGFGVAVLAGVAIGAATGAALALFAPNAMRGRAGSIGTVRTMVAARYDLVARNGFAERARQALASIQQQNQPGGLAI